MKTLEDFTEEELNAVKLEDYVEFAVDLEEYPKYKDMLKIYKAGYEPLPEDCPLKGRSLEEVRKWWILTHDVPKKL